jgi:energy-coupling factor transporter ATP-binding protein EcfA2
MADISGCFIKKDKKDNVSEFGIATISDGQLYTSWYELPKKFDIDVTKQYNDDLPYERICNIIEDESRADLMLFYGEPGTGKSTLIKHLISMYPDRQFIFLDANILAGIQPAKFITYLTENENSILILEDCEKVLQSREIVENGIMSTILNITDGVISDILGIKLICTFNTALSKIDEALLRKGRLSLKYEFKKLSKDKAIALGGDGNDQSLADIFNKEENDYSKKVTRKIGF